MTAGPLPILLATDATAADYIRDIAPHALFILGVVFITAWLILRIRKRGSRNATQPTAREQLERYKTRDAVRGDLEGLMVDIEQLARRLGAQLDAKSQQLETLLAQADQRIADLGGEVPPAPPAVDRFEPSVPPVADAETEGEPDPPAEPVAAASPEPAAPDPSEPDPLVARVCALADSGTAPTDIARELNEPIGKIELILALRRASPSG